MARKKQETLVLFPEVLSITRKFTDAQFGALMRAVFAYRFGGEDYAGADMAIDVAFQAIASQIDRVREYSEINAQNAAGRQSKQKEAECSEMQGNPPPILSSPIQSCPIQSNPVQSVPVLSPSSMKEEGDRTEGEEEEETAVKPARPRVSLPSAEDMTARCQEKCTAMDAERFVDRYASVGWQKDWSAPVRTWVQKGSPPVSGM